MEEKSTTDNNYKTEVPVKQLDVETFKQYIINTNHKYLTAQRGICFAVVARIYRRVLNNYYFGDIRIDGDMIVDGNHRYIAYMLAEVEFEIVNATRSHCDEVKNFNEIRIEINQDWDANNPDFKKYCNDDFLKDGKYLRNQLP